MKLRRKFSDVLPGDLIVFERTSYLVLSSPDYGVTEDVDRVYDFVDIQVLHEGKVRNIISLPNKPVTIMRMG